VAGVTAGGKCVTRSRKHRQGRACQRLVKVGGAPKAVDEPAGPVRLTWKPHGLGAGRYVLSVTPAGGRAEMVAFTVPG
jgi:hypothetical protein